MNDDSEIAVGEGTVADLVKRNWWLLILAGVASIVFGVLLFFHPGPGAVVLVWWIGSFVLIFGVLLMVLAFRMKNWNAFSGAKSRPAWQRKTNSFHD